MISFKWEKYTKNFFLYQFVLFLLFITAYFLDIYFYSIQNTDRSIVEMIIIKVFCLILIGCLAVYEFLQFLNEESKRDYFKDFWNYVDFLIITMYPTLVGADLSGLTPAYVTIGNCLFLVLMFLKLCFYLRIFESFSFLVSMIF